jgi:hypothetical protein
MVDKVQAPGESVADHEVGAERHLVVAQNGEPVYVLLEYELYQHLKRVIGEFRKAQKRELSPEMWKAVRRQAQMLEMMLAADRIRAEMDADPSSVVSHAELKRMLAEKKATLEAQHVGA